MTSNVRTFLLTVLLAVSAVAGVAQQVTLSMGSNAGAPGAVVNVDLTMTGGSQAAGLQWRLTPGTGISSVVFTASPSVTAAGKSLTCNTNGANIDCVLFGMNSNLLTDGVVATAAVTITAGTPLTTAALALSNVVASSAAGTTLAAVGTNGSVSITQASSTYAVSGTVAGGSGATVTLSGASSNTATADSNGNYSFGGLSNGSYTVAASKAGVTINPASQPVTINNANATANFTAAPQTWFIQGTTSGATGVTIALTGAMTNTATTDANGSYSFGGLINGTYTLTASKAGYTISPSTQSITINNNSATANFTATQQTWLIQGTTSGATGVTIALTGAMTNTATTDANGSYSFGGLVNGTYTLTASKAGYTLSPSTQSVTLNNNSATSVNFTATQQSTGTASVSMASPAGAPGTTVNVDLSMTAASGAQPVSLQWRVTPGSGAASTTFTASAAATAAGKSIQCTPNGTSLDCVLFGMNSTLLPNGVVATAAVTISPMTSVTVIPMNLSNVVTSSNGGTSIPTTSTDGVISVTQAPSSFTLSGTISGGGGATVALSGAASQTATADGAGNYTLSGLANGNYTVTPTKSGSTITPVNKAVTINGANATANFSATQQTWGISGVVSGGTATLTLTGPVNLTTSTDASGNYSFAGLPNGSYMLTPSASGFTFTPANRAITINGSNQTALNFTAAQQQTWSISGTITGGANAGVALSGGASKTTTADASGNYTFTGLSNGTYTVTPTVANATLTPVNRTVSINNASLPGTNFTATTNTTSTTPNVDASVSRDYSVANYTFEATISTASPNELLVAFISTNSTRNAQQVRSVAGAGLRWALAGRSNKQSGTAEIWYAFATQKLSAANFSANIAQKSTGQITVVAFSNVDTGSSGAAALGGVVSSSAASGAPWAPLTPTRAGSLVFAVGNDPNGAVARVPSAGQSLTHQFMVPKTGTMWVQRVDAPVKAGLQMIVGDDSPSGNAYNFTVLEIRGPVSAAAAPPPASGALISGQSVDTTDSGSSSGSGPVVNAAVTLVHPVTYEPANVCSPGGLATLLGADFTTQPAQSIVNASLPTKLAGAQVQVNGEYARLVMVSGDQIHFLCPNLVPGAPLDITVVSESGKLLRTAMTTMRAAAPALFTKPGSQTALFQLADADSAQNSASTTARRGETIRFYPASLGAVDAPITVGEVTPTDRKINLQNSLQVVINGVDVEPTFAGLAPGAVGLYQVDVQIPATAPVNPEVALSLKIRLADGTEILSNPAKIAIGTAALKDRRQ